MKNLLLIVLFLTVMLASPARADVVLASIISNHMVLQKSAKARIWGKADPDEEITVTLDRASGKVGTAAEVATERCA